MKTTTLLLPLLLWSFFIHAQSVPTQVEMIAFTGEDIRAEGFTSFSNDTYCIYGQIEESSLLSFYSSTGDLISNFSIDLIDGSEYVDELVEGQNEVLYGIIRKPTVVGLPQFVFAMDLTTQNILWTQKFDDPVFDASRLEVLVEIPEDGKLLVFGNLTHAVAPGSGQDYLVLELDIESGDLLDWKTSQIGNTDNYRDAILHDEYIYTCGTTRLGSGLDDIRPCFAKLNKDGDLIWLKYFLKPDFVSARAYARSMVHVDDGFIIFGHGNLLGDNMEFSTYQMYRVTFDGEFVWGLELYPDINDSKFNLSEKLVKVDGGVIALGSYEDEFGVGQTTFFSVSDAGVFNWAREVKPEEDPYVGLGLHQYDDRIVISGYATGQNEYQIVANLNFEGQIEGPLCPILRFVPFSTAGLVSEDYDSPFITYSPNLALESISDVDLDYFSLEQTIICQGVPVVSNTSSIPGVEINVYPNPASNLLIVEIDEVNYSPDLDVQITNAAGLEYFSSNLKGVQSELNISNLPAGLYLMSITNVKGAIIYSAKVSIIK